MIIFLEGSQGCGKSTLIEKLEEDFKEVVDLGGLIFNHLPYDFSDWDIIQRKMRTYADQPKKLFDYMETAHKKYLDSVKGFAQDKILVCSRSMLSACCYQNLTPHLLRSYGFECEIQGEFEANTFRNFMNESIRKLRVEGYMEVYVLIFPEQESWFARRLEEELWTEEEKHKKYLEYDASVVAYKQISEELIYNTINDEYRVESFASFCEGFDRVRKLITENL